jgi:hypothetical protein
LELITSILDDLDSKKSQEMFPYCQLRLLRKLYVSAEITYPIESSSARMMYDEERCELELEMETGGG